MSSYLHQCSGYDKNESCETMDNLMEYSPSANDSEAGDHSVERFLSKTTRKKRRTKTAKSSTKKDIGAFPSRFTSEVSTALSTSLPSEALSSCFAASGATRGYNKKKKIRKSVQFAEVEQCQDTISLQDYSKKERMNCWDTMVDIIERDVSLDLLQSKIEENKSPKDDETYRGLEDFHPQRREQKYRRRESIIQSVLRSQIALGQIGVVDPDYISLASIELSIDSKTDALERGMADMLEALPGFFETKKPRRSLPDNGERMATIADPLPLKDPSRSYSAPASTFLPAKKSQKVSEDDSVLDLCSLLSISDVDVAPKTRKSKKSAKKPPRRHSFDSHGQCKSKSKSRSNTASSGKSPNKSNIVKTLSTSSLTKSKKTVKKKAKASIAPSHDLALSTRKKDSKSRSRSDSLSSRSLRSRSGKNPLLTCAAELPSSPPSSKKQTRKNILSTSTHTNPNSTPRIHGIVGRGLDGNEGRVHPPTPPRKDPPGILTRISSIRLDDNYPPVVSRH